MAGIRTSRVWALSGEGANNPTEAGFCKTEQDRPGRSGALRTGGGVISPGGALRTAGGVIGPRSAERRHTGGSPWAGPAQEVLSACRAGSGATGHEIMSGRIQTQ